MINPHPPGRETPATEWTIFSKHLQCLPVAESGRCIRALGFAGAGLTVRATGGVGPECVRQGVPEPIRSRPDWGLSVPLVTTALPSATDAHARDVLETAAAAGIKEAKLGYVPVKEFGTFQTTLEKFIRELDGLEKLA